MMRRAWMTIPALAAAGVLLALPAGAQDAHDEQTSLVDRLLADGMTREEMVGLYEALAVGEFEPPDCVPGEEMFDDVPAASPFCSWIEELARRGITSGCGGNNYCPSASVSRAQMAVFLMRSQVTPGAVVALCCFNEGDTDVSTTPTQLNIGTRTFNKVHGAASTRVELILNSRVSSGTFAGGASTLLLQVRVDGAASELTSGYRIHASNVVERVVLNTIFADLDAGIHTVTVWAQTNAGTSSGVIVDPGGFGGTILVKEY